MKQTEPFVMTVNELAAYWRVTPFTICRLLRRKRLPEFRIGSEYRFIRESVERWMGEQEQGPDYPKL
jgi:excisionase family DNA binding protein